MNGDFGGDHGDMARAFYGECEEAPPSVRETFDPVQFAHEAAQNVRKLRRENGELVSALEAIHEALKNGVPSVAETLAYNALAKWGRG